MTIAVFDLTEHTQMSIRGTTGTHPDSKYVFGVYISTEGMHSEENGYLPEITAYQDMDWSNAVELAKWILDKNTKSHIPTWDRPIAPHVSVSQTGFSSGDPSQHYSFLITIEILYGSASDILGRWFDHVHGGVGDGCSWERATELAQWILEWDDRFKEEKE